MCTLHSGSQNDECSLLAACAGNRKKLLGFSAALRVLVRSVLRREIPGEDERNAFVRADWKSYAAVPDSSKLGSGTILLYTFAPAVPCGCSAAGYLRRAFNSPRLMPGDGVDIMCKHERALSSKAISILEDHADLIHAKLLDVIPGLRRNMLQFIIGNVIRVAQGADTRHPSFGVELIGPEDTKAWHEALWKCGLRRAAEQGHEVPVEVQ